MSEKIVIIPKKVLCTVTTQGFINLYYEYLGSYPAKEAYEMVEDLRELYYLPRRWNDYQSFSMAFYRKTLTRL